MIYLLMTNQTDTKMAAAITSRKIITTSPDGKWETFLQHAGLMRYVPSGMFFARFKVDGKIKRASLNTTVKTTAIDRLALKRNEFKKPKAAVGTFAEARKLYTADIENNHTLAPRTKGYWQGCVTALMASWPELDSLKLEKITEKDCRDWFKDFSARRHATGANNTLAVLRNILTCGGLGRDANPAYGTKHGSKKWRLGVPAKELTLPEPDQFEALVQAIETAGARQSQDCADLVRFLAYSGCRLWEDHQVTWSDIDFERGELRIHNGKRRKTSGAQVFRFVPMIPPMRELLERMRADKKPEPADRVCVLDECGKSLAAACGVKNGKRMTKIKRGKTVKCGIGIEVISHHDLRHLFATRCIESGVDIPTVSRWLGHNDGGVLAMKTYGHLRREHSQAMAQRVTFGTPATVPVSHQVSDAPVKRAGKV